MPKKIETVVLNDDEFFEYESFLQYGNLKAANIVFVGREEGLNEQSIHENHAGRKRWIENIKENIQYVNGDRKNGYYIDDRMKADWIRKMPELTFEQFIVYEKEHKRILVLKAESRLMVLIKEGFELLKNDSKSLLENMVDDYYINKLFRLDGETAMLDLYGLPKQDKREYKHNDVSYSGLSSHRKEILKNVYDSYDLPISFVFSGIENKIFRAEDLYTEIGFKFEEFTTSKVHPSYETKVNPSPKPKTFKIGYRSDKKQYCFITPFIGIAGSINATKEDCDVIATWIKAYYDAR